MGKVTLIKKSRKECTCNRCGKAIPVGSQYYRGSLNFSPDIVRCSDCGLESWEVTSSDYQLAVGEVVYRWYDNYGCDACTIDSIVSDLESVYDDLEGKYDNMPDSLQESDTGCLLQERMESVESAKDEVESIDYDEVRSDIIDEMTSENEELSEVEDWADSDDETYAEFRKELDEKVSEELSSRIEEALSNIVM